MDVLLVVGGIAGAVVVLVVVLMVALLGLGALRSRIAGVPALAEELRARGIEPRLAAVIVEELHAVANGPGSALAFVFLVFGIPALILGLHQLGADRFVEAEDVALYLAPGLAMIALGAALLLRARVGLERSPTYAAIFVRGPRAVEIAPTVVRMWITRANLVVNAMGMRERVLVPVPHLVLRYDDGSEQLVRALDDDDVLPTIRIVHALLPHCRIGAPRPEQDPLAQPA